MSAIDNPTAVTAVLSLKESLQKMPKDMQLFSRAMRSLYAENAVGTNDKISQKFRKLRDDTRNDAMVYLKGVLPLSTKFVASISEYFEYFEVLSLEEWVDKLPRILHETTGYKQLAETVLKMHEEILVPLKERQDEAKLLITESKELTDKFEKMEKELEDTASTKRGWAIGLAFVPFVNVIATPALAASASSDFAEAAAKGKEAKIVEAATVRVSDTLIPALNSFINGISNAAGFFSVMEHELKKFEGKADKRVTSPKCLYYKMMNKQARDMKQICQTFYAVLPAVRNNFLAIPIKGTDQNYVDRWLEKQKGIIYENATSKTLLTGLLKAISG